MSQAQTPRQRGFTMIELIIAMAIFTLLGSMVVFLMRRGLDIFDQGTREAALYDRLDTVLPVVVQDLKAVRIVMDTDPPPLPNQDPFAPAARPSEQLKPPETAIRLRSTHIELKRDLPESDRRRGFRMPMIAWVADMSEGLDPLYGELPTGAGPDAKVITPETVEARKADTFFKPSGGQVEIVYIAVPLNSAYPAVLTLFRGYRAPVGDAEGSLLVPENLDSIEKIKKACRPVAQGLLHFGVTWRRIFATSWEEDVLRQGTNGELTKYVGPHWDSTRGADAKWALFAGKQSLVDPSDDVFPSFARLEVALASPTAFGYGRGDTRLTASIGKDQREIQIENPDDLVQPGLGRDRYLKIGTEWMRYRSEYVNYEKRSVRVERGVRGTKAVDHPVDDWVYVGLPASTEMRMPVYKDRFTLPKEERGGR